MADAGYGAVGTGQILEQGIQTPLEEQPNFVKNTIGEMYAHPFRWAAWEYKYNLRLRPTNYIGKGMEWTGLMGWKALGRGQFRPWKAAENNLFLNRKDLVAGGAGRTITGGIVRSIGNLISGGAKEGSARFLAGKSFGAGGLYGLGEFLDSRGHVTSGVGLRALGNIFGGGMSNVGKFGYDLIGNKIEGLGASETANIIATSKGGLKRFNEFLFNKPTFSFKHAKYGTPEQLLSGGGGKVLSEDVIAGMVRKGATKEAATKAVTSFAAFRNIARFSSAALNLWAASSIVSTVAKTGYKVGSYAAQQLNAVLRNAPGLETGGVMPSYLATQGAITERQRALQAISASRLNARTALGGEAGLAHRTYVGGTYI